MTIFDKNCTRYSCALLAGFMGQKEDFLFLDRETHFYPIIPEGGFEPWIESFAAWSERLPRPRAVIAYSLGGRLALSAIARNKELYDRVILISTHLGLKEERARKKRLEDDFKWAEQFRTLPWDLLIEKWNRQEVLSSIYIARKEEDYDREILAKILEQYSLGRQFDYSEEKLAVYHILGAEDSKLYPFQNCYLTRMIEKSSHRVLWDNPSLVKKIIDELLCSVQ